MKAEGIITGGYILESVIKQMSHNPHLVKKILMACKTQR